MQPAAVSKKLRLAARGGRALALSAVSGNVDQRIMTGRREDGPKSPAAAAKEITTEEMLALPDRGVKRWLIRGELRERPRVLSNPTRSRIVVRVVCLLETWLEKQPQPRGEVLCGGVGVRLQRNPDTTVGIDVAYVSAERAACQSESDLIEGAPVLAAEIVSPDDTQEEINEKLDGYLQAGVALVWILDPRRRTVQVIRRGEEPTLVNVLQELSAEPQLPGFCVPVAQIFV
jgi:Uma2 family endonuclease